MKGAAPQSLERNVRGGSVGLGKGRDGRACRGHGRRTRPDLLDEAVRSPVGVVARRDREQHADAVLVGGDERGKACSVSRAQAGGD